MRRTLRAVAAAWRAWVPALAAAFLAMPALAGVLPEDRADVLYHRYQGGGITIQGPSVLVRKKIGDSLSVSANYYEDLISSASLDVQLSASKYKETRKQKSFSADYLHGKTTYSAGIINSVEPDYRANTSFYSVSQDMFGDLTTVTMSYKRGWDRVFADVKEDGKIVNQPDFGGTDAKGNPIAFRSADHRGYALGISQILTRNMLLSLNYEVLTDQGYLASPYRKIRYASAGGKGFQLADQIYPGTRTSNAGSALIKYYLPWRAALTAQYRFFTDTWGIVGHTGELGYTHPAWKRWIFDGSFRYYRQTSADFYSDLFPRANYANFMARDRELAQFQSYSFGVGASYEFNIPHVPWISKSTANLRFDHLMINYDNFRNALLTDPANGVFAGAEPLYKLNANVIQAFVSIYF
jgi:uncharacterized protein DUF3570